jgi:hypothetical protein
VKVDSDYLLKQTAMRKLIFILCLTTANVPGFSQYKKASFFERAGRTYDVGFSARLLGGGNSMRPCIQIGFGRDAGNRFFQWSEFEIWMGHKFNYMTVNYDVPPTAVKVNGKSKTGLGYRVNLAYHLLDPTKEGNKFHPYVTMNIGALMQISSEEYTLTTEPDNGYSIEKYPDEESFVFGVGGGLGMLYDVAKTISLRVAAGYTYQNNFKKTSSELEAPFKMSPSHPYVSIGVRFLMKEQ